METYKKIRLMIDDSEGWQSKEDENRADACIIFESPFQYSCCFVFPPFSPKVSSTPFRLSLGFFFWAKEE